jgi:hypothetical protein
MENIKLSGGSARTRNSTGVGTFISASFSPEDKSNGFNNNWIVCAGQNSCGRHCHFGRK